MSSSNAAGPILTPFGFEVATVKAEVAARGAFKAVMENEVTAVDRSHYEFEPTRLKYLCKRRKRSDDDDDVQELKRPKFIPSFAHDADGGVVIILPKENDERPGKPMWFIIPDDEFCTKVDVISKSFGGQHDSPYKAFFNMSSINIRSPRAPETGGYDMSDALGRLFNGQWAKYRKEDFFTSVRNAKYTTVMLSK